jgi:hypothetical protein
MKTPRELGVAPTACLGSRPETIGGVVHARQILRQKTNRANAINAPLELLDVLTVADPQK